MTVATKTLTVPAKAVSAQGTFLFEIFSNEVDSDNERVESWDNLPATVPLGYQHLASIGADPGAVVGDADARVAPAHGGLVGSGRLNLRGPAKSMATAVHERMLLPASNSNALSELSVGFQYDPERARRGPDGETVIAGARLVEISVVHAGAQRTAVSDVKSAVADARAEADAREAARALREGLPASPARTLSEQAEAMKVSHDAELVRLAFGEPSPAEVAAAQERARMEKARADLQMRSHAAELTARSLGHRPRVRVDKNFRPLFDELRDAREKDMRKREVAEQERRDAEREAEREQRERVRAERDKDRIRIEWPR